MNERGSALILAMVVMLLVTSMGIALLFLAQSELRVSTTDLHSKQAYFLAEAAIEEARKALFDTNGAGSFDDDLTNHAGGDAVIDFDPADVRAQFDDQGLLAAFTGFDDDVPLIATSQMGDGWYAAFLTNDPGDAGGINSTNDTNDRVMITGVGAARDGSYEIVQAIIEPVPPFASDVPATITMFGPNPSFSDVNNVAKVFNGSDCSGAGIPGFAVPVAGLIGTPSETVVEGSLNANTIYSGAGGAGNVAIADLTDPTDPGIVASSIGTIDDDWTDCGALVQMTEEVRNVADVVCLEGNPCVLPPSAPGRIIFAEGDFSLSALQSGAGMLWVTGTLTMSGAADWNGVIAVVGEGSFGRVGAGIGRISGATIVADIAGPDNAYGTADDCTGGTDGFAQAVHDESLGGTGETVYCSADVLAATPVTRYSIVSFRQR